MLNIFNNPGDLRISSIPSARIVYLSITHLILLVLGLSGIYYSGLCMKKDIEFCTQQAVMDALTGIPNRRSFSEHILKEYNRSLRNHLPLSVIMGDIDHFKGYNDSYGHVEGDNCLQRVAKSIESTLKRPGDFCARYGGEEFVMILPETDGQGARILADLICGNIEKLNITHEQNKPFGKVTISLGLASIKANQVENHQELIKLADAALYDAKSNGRNRVEERGASELPT